MRPRRLSILLLAPLLALTACRESKVTAYRIPKEKEPSADLPAGHPAMPGMDATAGAPQGGVSTPNMADTPVPTAEGPGLEWKAPADWKTMPSGAMRKATYSIDGPAGPAELSITAFPGNVGGELANLNRWRGQVGMAPLADADLDQNVDRKEINGLSVAIVDITDAQKPKGTLGMWVSYSGSMWFFKLTGPTASVQAQKSAYLAFLQTIKAPKQ